LTPQTSGVGVMPDVFSFNASGFTSSLWTDTSTRGNGYPSFYQAIGH